MSTKTTFKRVALVAVAALSLSVVAVAPSQAAANAYIYCSNADGGAIDNTSTTGATCQGVAGTSNYVTLTGVQTTKDVELTVSGSTFVASTSGWITNAGATIATAAAASAGGTIKVLTPTVGTITVTVKYATAGTGIYTASTETVVITVAATASSGAYSAAKSTAYIVAGETWTASADADTPVSALKTAVDDTATASIIVKYLDALGKPVVGDTLTATITSGPGTIATVKTVGAFLTMGSAAYKFDSRTIGAAASSGFVRTADQYSVGTPVETMTGTAGFYVFANNLPGLTTVVIKNSAGDVVATKTLTFTDTTPASLTATVVKNYVQGDAASVTHQAIKVVLKDAAGNVIPGGAAPAISTTSTLATGSNGTANWETATADTTGAVYYAVTPAAAKSYGVVTFKFTSGLVTTTADVTLSSAVASTITASASASAAAGDLITYTITAKDSAGRPVPDNSLGADYILSSVSTGGATGEPDFSAKKSVNGVWTATKAAPLTSATIKTVFTLTGTKATLDSHFTAALAGTDLAATTTAVSNPGIDAATDAANEATDAANAATDAANAAAEAADAATAAAQDASDAVAALSTKVDELIGALKKQITTLTNLVIKIQKKVKA